MKHTAAKLLRRCYWSDEGGSPSHVGVRQAGSGEALSPTAAHYLEGISIKLADEKEDAVSEEREGSLEAVAPLLKVTSPSSPRPGEAVSPSHLGTREKMAPSFPRSVSAGKSTASSLTMGKPLHPEPLHPKGSNWLLMGHGMKKMIPREWYVLSCPLPEVPSIPQSLLEALKESIKETVFHESIYYSKKIVSSKFNALQ